MRRGCVIDALRKFIISQGPSKNINNLEWDSFWAENKKFIDPVAKRFTSITAKNRFSSSLVEAVADCRVPITLLPGKDVPEKPLIKPVTCHKKNPDLGNKNVYYSNQIFVEQEDAQTFKPDEEVYLPQL